MNLVTGATGLLGIHVMYELIARGERVRGMRRHQSNLQLVKQLFEFYGHPEYFEKIEWVEADILEVISLQEALQGVEYVFHSAAVVSYHSRDRKEMYHVNVEGTANVVNAAQDAGVKRLVHVSSIAALKRTLNQVVDETGEWENSAINTHYGITKHLAEMEVWRGIQEGIDAVIINPGLIIGPGDFSRSSSSIFSKIDEGFAYYPPGGTAFVGVEDVAKLMVKLRDEGRSGERYIAVSQSWTMQELFVKISNALGRKTPSKEAKPWMLQVARIAEWFKEKLTGKKALVTIETVKNASLIFTYSSAKVQKEFGYQFQPIDQCIVDTVRFYKLHNRP